MRRPFSQRELPTAASQDNKIIYRQRGERIRTIRGMLRMTMAEFGAFCGYKEPTVQQWETSQLSGLTEKAARKIIEALKKTPIACHLNWLLHGQGLPPFIRSEDARIAKCQQDLISLGGEIDLIAYTQNEIERFTAYVPDAITIQMHDDSMEPALLAGDKVGGKQLFAEEDIQRALGKICIVTLSNHLVLVRKLFKDDTQPHKFKLSCTNLHAATEPVMTNVELISAAPVCRVWRRITE